MAGSGQIVCLSMIVKNEAHVVARCLASLRELIHYWVIVDTGSTDGTQDAIRSLMTGVPGELHQRGWRDFAHNRTEALELARPHGDYLLFIDADDALEHEPRFTMPALDADSYILRIADASTAYERTQIVRAALPWRWRGVLHEFLSCDQARTSGRLDGLRMRRNHDGARRLDPHTYRRDAEILAGALQTEGDPFMRARYQFYLAQSYRDCGEQEKSLQAYLARAEMGFWTEEVFVSLYSAAKLQAALQRPLDDVVATYLRAADTAPQRIEALHGASRHCRLAGRFKEGYDIARRAAPRSEAPPDGLFVEPWIYEYGLLDELAVNAYWAGAYHECLDACERILREGRCPETERARIEANAAFAREKLGPLHIVADRAQVADVPTAVTTSRRLKIAVYAIALNEIKHVERWAASARDADYLVVADTGSSDGTAERCFVEGIQVDRISVDPWRFDDARNASLALVPADADVCIALDLDEFMMPGWRAAVEGAWTPDATRLEYNFAPNCQGPGTSRHVIRKSKVHARRGYRWKRIVHEDLAWTGAGEKVIEIDSVLVGQSQDLTKDRSSYLPLLERAHDEDPDDSQICFWLGRDLMHAKRNDRAAEILRAYLDLPSSAWPDERAEAMRLLARVEPQRKRAWLQQAVVEAPHRRELWIDLAEFFHDERNWPDLFWACTNGIERTQRNGSYLDDPAAWGFRLYDLGALACSHLGLIDQANEWGRKALDLAPGDSRLVSNLAFYRRLAPARSA